MGIKNEDCIIDNSSTYELTNSFYCPTIGRNHCSYFNIGLINELVSDSIRLKPLDYTDHFERVFICRKKGTVRSIYNHTEIINRDKLWLQNNLL